MAKKRFSRFGFGIAVLVALLGGFLAFQYREYKQLPDLRKVTLFPTEVGRDSMFNGARYFRFIFHQPMTEAQYQAVAVTVSPSFEHKLYVASEWDITANVIGPQGIADAKAKLEKIRPGRYEEMINGFYSTSKDLVIERTGPPLVPKTDYTLTISQKKWNLFSLVHGASSRSFSFHTFNNPEDENEDVQRAFRYGSFSSMLDPKFVPYRRKDR